VLTVDLEREVVHLWNAGHRNLAGRLRGTVVCICASAPYRLSTSSSRSATPSAPSPVTGRTTTAPMQAPCAKRGTCRVSAYAT